MILKTKYNIIAGAMATITMGKFAGTVSKHGALGIIASGGLSADQLRTEIEIAQSITDNPIGVNLMLMNKNAKELIDVMIEKGIHAFTYGGGDITPFKDRLKENNILQIALVNTVERALAEEKNGADIIVAEGTEAGGHIGLISTMTLLPQVVDAVSVPVFAAGGIADKRGVEAAKALGAKGVQIGTRFIASHECTLPDAYKQAVIDAKDTDTTVTGIKFGTPVRVLQNELSKKYREMEYEGASFADLEKITKGSLKRSVLEGDMETGSVMIGQVAGLIKEILSVEEIIQSLI